MTLVSASTKMAISGASFRSAGDPDRFASGFQHRRLADELGRRDAGVEDDLAALLGVGAVEADDDRRPQLDAREALDDALGDLFATGDGAEGVDEARRQFLVVV